MKLFRDLRQVEQLERKHRRKQLLIDIALTSAVLAAGGLALALVIYATR